jgi:hypothetical protein
LLAVIAPAATSCSFDPRLAIQAPPLSLPTDLFDKPAPFLPYSLRPALIALPLVQHHTIFYIFSLVNSLLMQSGTIQGA